MIRFISLIISISLISIAFFNPMGLIKNGISTQNGIDCIWLLDVSKSMDIQDITYNNEVISRLQKAKYFIEEYMVAHPENQYGLIIFAGTSRLISPITSNHSSILNFLANVSSKSITTGGTNFYDGLSLAKERFRFNSNISHLIVLLSDGGDKEDFSDKNSIKNIFQGENIILDTIGIGKMKPMPIPIGVNPIGEIIYKKFQGEMILSGLNKENLESLAKIGKGSYIENISIKKLEKNLETISRHTFPSSENGENDETLRLLIAISFFFFLLFLLFPSASKRGNTL